MSPQPRVTVAVIDDWYGQHRVSQGLRQLAQHDDVELRVYEDEVAFETLVTRLSDVDAVIPMRERTSITRALLEACPNLTLIAQTGGGTTHIDMEAAQEQGVTVLTTHGASATSVAELTLGLMIAVVRNFGTATRSFAHGRWEPQVGAELSGKRLGVLGLGVSGWRVAQFGVALGMEVAAWTRSGRRPPEGVRAMESVSELLPRSDVLSVHVKLTEETRRMIGGEELDLLPADAIVINTARGAVIDESALAERLASGRLAGAGLDVFVDEPIREEHPFLRLENVFMTPHVGWQTNETYERYLDGCVNNIAHHFSLTGW